MRMTLTAQKREEPRVFSQGGRYEGMVKGLTPPQKEKRVNEIARGSMHWAIPSEERLHLLVTMHHGHQQGEHKCKGDKALCAACLKTGRRVEEGALHEHHECPMLAREVWKGVAHAWEAATGEALDVSDPLLTVMGVRPAATGPGREKLEALEPAWRLLHSVTLRQIHGARNRVHAAHHAKTPREPRRATSRHVMSAVKQRMQQRIQYEHARAESRAAHGLNQGARASFQKWWVLTGVADMHKGRPRLNMWQIKHAENIEPGIHIRTAAAAVKRTAKQPPAAGWLLEEAAVGQDGEERSCLRARGAVPSRDTHKATTPPHALSKQTEQGAHLAALGRGLRRAGQHLARDSTTKVTITVASITTMERMKRAARRHEEEGALRTAQPAETRGMTVREQLNQHKRRREETEPPKRKGNNSMNDQENENWEKLTELRRRYPNRLHLRAPTHAVRTNLRQQAAAAARFTDLDARVTKIAADGRERSERSVPRWDQTRVWDPGD